MMGNQDAGAGICCQLTQQRAEILTNGGVLVRIGGNKGLERVEDDELEAVDLQKLPAEVFIFLRDLHALEGAAEQCHDTAGVRERDDDQPFGLDQAPLLRVEPLQTTMDLLHVVLRGYDDRRATTFHLSTQKSRLALSVR